MSHLALLQDSEADAWVGGVWQPTKDDWQQPENLSVAWAKYSSHLLSVPLTNRRSSIYDEETAGSERSSQDWLGFGWEGRFLGGIVRGPLHQTMVLGSTISSSIRVCMNAWLHIVTLVGLQRHLKSYRRDCGPSQSIPKPTSVLDTALITVRSQHCMTQVVTD